jgi:hypothetical protein
MLDVRPTPSPEFSRALREYQQRDQFHDAFRLEKLIEAVREEERTRFNNLLHAAKEIVAGSLKL